MKKILLILLFLVISGRLKAECVETPNCTDLGYIKTAADCKNRKMVRCPWNKALVYCKLLPLNTEILYSDMTTSPWVLKNKTPIGVVVDAKERLAVALDEGYFNWGNTLIDIPELKRCNFEMTNNEDCYNGKKNTQIITNFGKANSISFPPIDYCNNYSTPGTHPGQWFLPSRGQILKINQIIPSKYSLDDTAANEAVSRLQKPRLSGPYWTSTLCHDNKSADGGKDRSYWDASVGYGNSGCGELAFNRNFHPVRPMIQY